MQNSKAMYTANLWKPPLFAPLPTSSLLHCPATGHFYCLITGSLFHVMPRLPVPLIHQTALLSQVQVKQNQHQGKKSKNKNKNVDPSVQNMNTSSCIQNHKTPNKKKKKKEEKLTSRKAKSMKSSGPSKPVYEEKTFKRNLAWNEEDRRIVTYKKNHFGITKTGIFSSSESKRHPAAKRRCIYFPYNPFTNGKKQSYKYFITALQPATKLIKPHHVICDHIFLPWRKSLPVTLNIRKSLRKYLVSPVDILSAAEKKYPSEPPDSCSYADSGVVLDVEFDLEGNFRKKTSKQKKCVQKKDKNISEWGSFSPFRRRSRSPLSHHRRNLIWGNQVKNCILTSSVHEIVHSQFIKKTNELMPVSQLRAMLNPRYGKLIPDQEWKKSMEQEAIQKYKKVKFENHKQDLQVQYYDVLRHPEKSWLIAVSRWVKPRHREKGWPLLVKCLYKHPESTIQHASKHRSFCLLKHDTSYTLRRDHAYYTQMQCHMAITKTKYGELIVHTHKETAIVSVHFDPEFWETIESKLESFFTTNVLPYLKMNEIEPKVTEQLFEFVTFESSEEELL